MNRLLLTIDFINELVHPDGKGASNIVPHLKQQHAIEHANQAIKIARQNELILAHVKVGFQADYSDCPKNSPMFSKAAENNRLKLGTWGTEFYTGLEIEPSDNIIIKNRVSPFFNTNLERFLIQNKIQQLIICGVSTQMAVASAAKDAHDRDYQVIILQDACASSDEENHFSVLQNLQRLAKVINTNQLKNVLKSKNATPLT